MQTDVHMSHDQALSNMDGSDLKFLTSDYQESLHFKMAQKQKDEKFQTRGMLLGISKIQPVPLKTSIRFGETKLQ